MKPTSDIIAEIAARVDGEENKLPQGRGGRRAREEYFALLHMREQCYSELFAPFDVIWPVGEDDESRAAFLAICELGLCIANVIAEPREKPGRIKARHAGEADAEIVNAAPRWRFADDTLRRDPKRPDLPAWREEAGTPAIILPVASSVTLSIALSGYSLGDTLSCWRMSDDEFAESVSDLIAIPLDGSRPLSLTGHTVAVGAFLADERGRLILHASGRAWLDAHVARARAIASETPPHLVQKLHLPFPAPWNFSTLLLEPRALEWRVSQIDCVVPDAAREIVCPDSRSLAEWIDAEMKKRERARPLPVVRGPAEKRAGAA